MACDDLIATVADVEARLQRQLTKEDEITTVTALLQDASSMVRAITGEPFGEATYTVRRNVRGGRVFMSSSDITAVSAVSTVTGTALASTWDGLHWIRVGSPDVFDVEGTASDVVEITYTRSGDPAPQWVVGLVAQMAARAFGRPADQSGVQQESIQGYSYSVGVAAAAGGIGLLQYEENRLREFFPPPVGTAWVGIDR